MVWLNSWENELSTLSAINKKGMNKFLVMINGLLLLQL
jgi:hypothetical protein